MSAQLEILELSAPAYWASYLINCDASGLDPEEKERADRFLARIGHGFPVTTTGDERLSRYSDASPESPLAGDVLTYVWLV